MTVLTNLLISKDLVVVFVMSIIFSPLYIFYLVKNKGSSIKDFLIIPISILQSFLINFIFLFGFNYFGNFNLGDFYTTLLLFTLFLNILFSVHYTISFENLERKMWKKHSIFDISKFSLKKDLMVFVLFLGFILLLLLSLFIFAGSGLEVYILSVLLVTILNLFSLLFFIPQIIGFIRNF